MQAWVRTSPQTLLCDNRWKSEDGGCAFSDPGARVAAAVAALRQAAPAAVATVSAEERMATLQRRFDQFVTDYRELAGASLSLEEKSEVRTMLSNALLTLHRVELQQR